MRFKLNTMNDDSVNDVKLEVLSRLTALKKDQPRKLFLLVIRLIARHIVKTVWWCAGDLVESTQSTNNGQIMYIFSKFSLLLMEPSEISKDFARILSEEILIACPAIKGEFMETKQEQDYIAILKFYFVLTTKLSTESQATIVTDLVFNEGDLWEWMALAINSLNEPPTKLGIQNVVGFLDTFVTTCSQVMLQTYGIQFQKAMKFLYNRTSELFESESCSQCLKSDLLILKLRISAIRP
ncbi:hypothetical protein ACOME3_006118 [Neoechinorhynchus agilis]